MVWARQVDQMPHHRYPAESNILAWGSDDRDWLVAVDAINSEKWLGKSFCVWFHLSLGVGSGGVRVERSHIAGPWWPVVV